MPNAHVEPISGEDVGPQRVAGAKKARSWCPLLLRPRTTKTLRKGSSDFKDQSQAKGAGPACSVFPATPVSRELGAGGGGAVTNRVRARQAVEGPRFCVHRASSARRPQKIGRKNKKSRTRRFRLSDSTNYIIARLRGFWTRFWNFILCFCSVC